MKNTRDKWWVCYNPYPEGGKPHYKHSTKQGAIDEAKRISGMTGRKIHVLELCGSVMPPTVKIEYKEALDRGL